MNLKKAKLLPGEYFGYVTIIFFLGLKLRRIISKRKRSFHCELNLNSMKIILYSLIIVIIGYRLKLVAGKRIVLTADCSLMTNYRGNFLYGFIACGPYELVPEFVFDKLFCPSVETKKDTGEIKVAQCGLRRIESALLQEYTRNDIFLAHPEMLDKCIGPDTKVVGINVMDPLGMAPVTTTMSPEKLSYVAMKFKKMCASIIQLKKKYDFKVVVGGNGSWELAKPERMKIHGIDTVVIGEADELALDLFHDLEAGDAPELLHTFVRNIENIPTIQGPTINSLIEAMRGCGRGCDFCDVNKRSKKDIPLPRLQEEAKINIKYGFDSIWLQSDEMLLYGCDNKDFIPNQDAISRCLERIKIYWRQFYWHDSYDLISCCFIS